MGDFNNRENFFEKKYIATQEEKFFINGKTRQAFGEWVGDQIYKDQTLSKQYATNLANEHLVHADFDEIIAHVKKDLESHNIDLSERILTVQLEKIYHSLKKEGV